MQLFYIGLFFDGEKTDLRPSTQRLLNTRPAELLVPGGTTTMSTSDLPRPPIIRPGLTEASLAACLRDTAHKVHIRSA